MTKEYNLFIPVPPEYKEGEGKKYSIKLATKAQLLSFWFNIFSWSFILGGAVNIFLLSVPDIKGSQLTFEIPNSSNLIYILLWSLLIKMGLEIKKRAKDASRLGSAANRAITLSQANKNEAGESGDLQVYKMSVEAKSIWLEGRMNQQYLDKIIQQIKEST